MSASAVPFAFGTGRNIRVYGKRADVIAFAVNGVFSEVIENRRRRPRQCSWRSPADVGAKREEDDGAGRAASTANPTGFGSLS
jgi:hypothetical protein